jgi:hypothetical protein
VVELGLQSIPASGDGESDVVALFSELTGDVGMMA